MIFVIPDCDGQMVEINASTMGDILHQAYLLEYDGDDDIEEFIDWFMNDYPDFDDDEDEDDEY